MVNKKAVIIATVIAIIVIGIIFGMKVYKFNKDDNTEVALENKNTNINKVDKNSANNTTSKNNVNETNNLEENNTNTEITNNTDENTSKTDNQEGKDENNVNTYTNTTAKTTNKTTEEDPEKIAIKLVKDKFGKKSSNIYYNVDDELSDGIYIVSIRDEQTTTEIASYKVDIKNKTVTEN